VKKRTPRRGRGTTTASPGRGARRVAPAPTRRAGPAAASRALHDELKALREEVERTAAGVKEAIGKIERLTIAVADLQDDVADLQASLGDGEVEYGPVNEDNSEMGEGHA